MPAVEVNRDLADRARIQLGDAVRTFLAERTAVDSPLFDVSTKMAYGNYSAVRSIPLLMDLVSQRLTPEEVGSKLKTMGVPLGLAMNGLGWVLTMGRIQLYKDAGWPEQPDVVVDEDARGAEVFTWWSRIMAAYRNDGGLVPGQGDTPETFEILPADVVADVAATALSDGAVAADGTVAGGGDRDVLRRCIAELDMFEFVTHAEARDGIHQHGPYRLPDGRTVLFKEFTDLQGKYMPGKGDENRLAVSRVVMALVLREVNIRFDLFAIYADPENFLDHVEGVAVYVDDDLRQITLPELSEIATASVKAQRDYFLKMARWDDRTKVTHASSQYANDFHALLLVAGYTEEEIATFWVKPFEADAEAYYDRATGPTRLGAFEHLLGGGEPVTPPFPDEATWTTVGTGEYVSGSEPVEGTVVEISTTEDVLPLFDECPSDLIVLLHTSGGTILSPLFSDIKAVISTVGSKGSHVAILSREFGIPCVMGTALSDGALNGRHVRIDTDGSVQASSR